MNPAVVVRLRGGLGNQMFQYATALALAQRHGGEVQLDPRALQPRGGSPALLRCQVPARLLGRPQAWRYTRPALALARRQRWFARLLRCHAEQGLRFDPAVLAQALPLHIDGYFQSERYFTGLRDTLQHQFRPRTALGTAQRAMAQRIAAQPGSVALHVRRGDYLQPANLAVHGVCSPAYYEAAARLVTARTGAQHFFVFSDDPGWARDTLRLPGPTVHVDGQQDTPEIDLNLMALCSHHVCANSSFAWWGAWLGAGPGQTVVAPARWFADPRLDAADIVPAHWLRL